MQSKGAWFSVNWACEGQHPARDGAVLRVKEDWEQWYPSGWRLEVSFLCPGKGKPRKKSSSNKETKKPKNLHAQESRKRIHSVVQPFDLVHFTVLQCIFKQFNCSYVLFLMLKSIVHRYPPFCFTPFLTSISWKGLYEYVNQKMQCKNWLHSREGCEERGKLSDT